MTLPVDYVGLGRHAAVRAALWCVLCATAAADEGYSYPEYEKADAFTAPCGQYHSGSNTADVSEWARKKPWFDDAKAHMDEYLWLEYAEPCPLKPGQLSEESCTPTSEVPTLEQTQLCLSADLSGDATTNELACEGLGAPGSIQECSGGYPCCSYFNPGAGCTYSKLSDGGWQELAQNFDFANIQPEQHPANYLLAVAYYAVWLFVQAVASLIGAVLSCCCLHKKEMDEQPGNAVMWAARAILGSLLLATIVMANSMELLGNRDLNDSMHNALSSVEGLTKYLDEWIEVGNGFLDVGDSVLTQVGVVNRTIFENADPVELQAAATCMQDIGASCEEPSYEDLMGQYFVWAGEGDGPEGSPPSAGKCDTSVYTEDQDYILGTTLETQGNVILDAIPAGAGRCAIFCLVGQSGCTGAQWTMQDDGAGGQTESACVLWLNNQCDSSISTAAGYTATDASVFTQVNPPIDVVYKRVYSTSVPASETECVQTKTVATVNKINDNVVALPADIMDIITVMDSMMANQVTLCLLDGLATPLGDGLAALVPTIESLQETLEGLMATMRDGIRSGRASLEVADDAYEKLRPGTPPPPGDWGVWHTENGEDYPMDTVVEPAKLAECNGGTSCFLNVDETDCMPSSTDNCYFVPATPEGPETLVEHTCTALACYHNTLDFYDENRGGLLPIARTQLFSIFSMMATFGSLLGLIALGTNKMLLWKLMCFLFFFWGPASLILSGAAHPPMIFASDACQDIEEVAIDAVLAQNPELSGSFPLVKGDDIMEFVNSLPNFNYTGAPIADVEVDDVPALMRYYILDNCDSPAGIPIDEALTALEDIMLDVVQVMASNAGEMVEEMASQMGDSGMELRPAVVANIAAITDIVAQDVPPQISFAFNRLRCPRISRAYYDVKSPICCDVVVAMYWVAYPLSVMGFCTLAAMFLTIFLGAKAFPGEPVEQTSVENPAYDK